MSRGARSWARPRAASARWRWADCSLVPSRGLRASVATGERSRRPAPLRSEGQARALPVPIGRVLARRFVRLQADARQVPRPRDSRLGEGRPAAHRHDLRPNQLSGRRADSLRPAVRRAADVDQRSVAAHADDRRRHLPREVDVHRGDQSRPGDHVHQHRQSAAGLREHGRVGQLRTGQRERQPADVHRDGLARLGQESGAADLLAAVGQRLLAVVVSGRGPPAGRRARCSISTIRPASRATSAARCSTISISSTSSAPPSSAIRRRWPASMPTRWRFACRPRCRSSPI